MHQRLHAERNQAQPKPCENVCHAWCSIIPTVFPVRFPLSRPDADRSQW